MAAWYSEGAGTPQLDSWLHTLLPHLCSGALGADGSLRTGYRVWVLGCKVGTGAKHSMLTCPFQRLTGDLEGKEPAVASQPAQAGNLV